MTNWRNAVFWGCFIILAICVQALAPGLDVLVVGLIILLQEEDYSGMLWLLPLFVLLQEGMGTRPFGAIIVWYAAVILLFKLGCWLFNAKNFIFIFILSACLGGTYFAIAWLMSPLQNLAFNVGDTLDKSLVQAVFLPFAWYALSALRNDHTDDEENG